MLLVPLALVGSVAFAQADPAQPEVESFAEIAMGVDVSVKKGGAQIEYEDQDPRVHRLFLEELKKNGVQCRMNEFMDESILLKPKVAAV